MVDLKLVDYIRRHVDRGYGKEEIKKILIENQWDKNEVGKAMKFLEEKKSPVKKIIPKSKPVITQPQDMAKLQILKNFISNSQAKGIKDSEIRNALLAKKWPEALVAEGFADLRKPTITQKPAITQKPTITQKPKKERKPFDWKMLVWYLVAFIVAATIITGTIFVYYYVVGLSDYTVSVDGESLHGKCLQLNCSDMKGSAMEYANESLITMIIIGLISSLLIVSLYAFLPYRHVVLWIVNVLYFIFLVYIGYVWISFTGSL
jgi:hypothetical protein